MNNYTQKTVRKFYFDKIKKHLSYSDIRNDLKSEGYDKETITDIMNDIDLIVVEKELQQNIKRRYISIISTGFLLCSIGLFTSICCLFNLFGSDFKIYLTILPLIFGCFLSLRGKAMYKKYNKQYKI